jgi:hypothetical protein
MALVIAPLIKMSDDQQVTLMSTAKSSSLPHRSVTQAEALLLAADGVANEEIARRCATTPDKVRRWSARFESHRSRRRGQDRRRPGAEVVAARRDCC